MAKFEKGKRMNYKIGKTYHFFNDDNKDNVCKAHVLHIMPHPEADGVFLIIYRWFGFYHRWWHYAVTDTDEQDGYADYVKRRLQRRKEMKNN